jgi:hypothetical protein
METVGIVSGMETHGAGSDLTPEEARDALRIADAEEAATVNRPVPWWYFPMLAVLVLALFLLNMVDDPAPPLRGLIIALTLAVAVTIAALVGRISFHQPGYRGVRTPLGSTIVAVIVAGGLAIAPLLFADIVGAWLWAACGLVLSGLVAGFGIAYWRRYPRG